MTIERSQLILIAHRQLRSAQNTLEEDGAFNPRFVIVEADGHVIDIVLPDPLGLIMNDGRHKTMVFDLMRDHIQEHHSVAAIFVSEASLGKATAKGLQHARELEAMAREDNGKLDRLVENGFIEHVDVILVTIHTPETVTTIAQEFARDYRLKLVTYGAVQTMDVPQANFRGRQKMFGDLREKNLG